MFDQVDKTNYAATSFAKQVHEKINHVCQPLLEYLSIEGFAYFNILPNGYGISLSNQLDTLQIYHDYLSKEGSLYPEEFKKTSQERPHYFIWTRYSSIRGYNFPISTGINIYRKNSLYYEGFVFYTHKITPGLESLFLDNLSLLDKFGESFKLQCQDIIAMDDPSKLIWARDGDSVLRSTFDPLRQDVTPQQFLKCIKPSQLYIHSFKGDDVLLSKRETECMHMLCMGKTSKEIGRQLNLSTRTIETYLERIKDKSGFNLKSEIIEAFYESFIKWT